MKAAVIVFPGSNCDRDVAVALTQSMGRPADMVWHRETALPDTDLIVIPGGFSYGDYLRSGAMAAHSPILREVKAKASQGVPVLAICNGFQIATEAGLLPGALMANTRLKYICKDVELTVENSQTMFTSFYEAGQRLRIPIAHHDGNYFADDDVLDRLEDEDRIAFRYVDNPNGSARDIAGIFNREKTVLGMMPHPERLSDPALGGNDGRAMFDGLVGALS